MLFGIYMILNLKQQVQEQIQELLTYSCRHGPPPISVLIYLSYDIFFSLMSHLLVLFICVLGGGIAFILFWLPNIHFVLFFVVVTEHQFSSTETISTPYALPMCFG